MNSAGQTGNGEEVKKRKSAVIRIKLCFAQSIYNILCRTEKNALAAGKRENGKKGNRENGTRQSKESKEDYRKKHIQTDYT